MNTIGIDNLLEHVDSIHQIIDMYLDTDKCGANVHLKGEDLCVTIKTNSGPSFLIPGPNANSDWLAAHHEWRRIFNHETLGSLLPWLKEYHQEAWLRKTISIIENTATAECESKGPLTLN